MIVFHPPIDWGRTLNRRLGKSTHLVSTELGESGHRELLAFATQLGLSPAWIQDKGTPHEHFDIFENRIARAVTLGAKEVSKREVVLVWRRKKAAV